MTTARRFRAGVIVLFLVVVGATGAYMALEGFSFIDAFYMTIITISTVGFEEVGGGLDTTGRLLTVLVILTGTGAALYTAAIGLEYGIETLVGGDRERRRVHQQIDKVRDHIILCGFGRVGKTAWEQLDDEGATVVVIDSDPVRVAEALERGALCIEGNATSDDVLEEAGIDQAKVLISAVRSDSDNLVITLSAKAKRPDLLVVARVVDAETGKKMYLAGADRVVAPQHVGGQRLAALALKPDLAEFIDLVVSGRTVEFRVEEFSVPDDSEVIGRSIRDIDVRRRAGALLLAVGDTAGRLSLNPDPGMVFKPGQIVVAIGTADQLDALRAIVGGS